MVARQRQEIDTRWRPRWRPPDELVRFCDEQEIDVAVLTLVNSDCHELAHATGTRIEESGTPVIVADRAAHSGNSSNRLERPLVARRDREVRS
jgi:hypothetical protein